MHRELRWKFREQHESDVGVDAHIEVVERQRPTGRLLAMQIKAGSSWFREPATSRRGWVFRGSRRHLGYWLDHDLPVLVVLYDDDLQVAYWQRVTAATVEVTGAGFKLVVPADNRLDASAAQPLHNLATTTPAQRRNDGTPRRPVTRADVDQVWDWVAGTGGELPRVGEITDRALLGLHPAISLPPEADPGLPVDLPTYVARDADTQVRAAMAAAGAAGGFVVLIGAAAAGKTRCAYEAARSVLPTWRMLMPASAADLVDLVVGGVRLGRTVVWLDDLVTVLGPGGLTARLIRRLRADPAEPVVIIGTVSPGAYDRLRARPPTRMVAPAAPAVPAHSDAAAGDPAWPGAHERRHARPDAHNADLTDDARQVLDLVTHQVWVAERLSPAERIRAEAVAAGDPRIADALAYRTDLGLPAVLAAAPELIQRLYQPDPSLGREVLAAAVDARRCGHPGPIPADLLRGLADEVYLTGAQRATAGAEWFAVALASACRPVREISAPMWPTASRVGQVDGYAVTDILVQHLPEPAGPPDPPAQATWDYLARSADSSACFGIGVAAYAAQRLPAARMALERAAEAGHHKAMNNLGVVLGKLGDQIGAHTWYLRGADSGDPSAMYNLALDAEQDGDLDAAQRWYRRAADAGHGPAMFTLGFLARDAGDLDGARRWYQAAVDAGHTDARTNLATVLDAQGDTDAAQHWYLRAIEAGSTNAMLNLGNLLTEQGDPDAAHLWWAKAAAAGNTIAMYNLGNHLVAADDFDAGCGWLQRAVDAGHAAAANNLALVVKDRGDIAQARALLERAADAGDTKAINNLGNLVEHAGEADAARRWYQRAVDRGDPRAKYHLGAMSARDGDLHPLRTWLLEGVDADDANMLALGHLHAQLGDLDTIRDGLSRAFAISDVMAVNLGVLLATFGDTATVQAAFQHAAIAGRKVPMGMMAGVLAHFGEIDVIRAWFRDAVARNDLVLIAHLGWVLYEGHDPDIVKNALRTLTERGHLETATQLRHITEATDRRR